MTYSVQRTERASPALCPVRVLPVRVPLGQAPFLPAVRRSKGSFVPVVRRYYGPVRLLATVHHGVTATGLSHATRRANSVEWPRDLPVLAHGASTHARGLRPRGVRSGTCRSALPGVAFRTPKDVGTPKCCFRGSIARPTLPLSTLRPRSNKSDRLPSRAVPHDSRPGWVATPFL